MGRTKNTLREPLSHGVDGRGRWGYCSGHKLLGDQAAGGLQNNPSHTCLCEVPVDNQPLFNVTAI